MTATPLFMTGIARGGTSLIGRMIDAHPDAAVAIDAFLPLFRASRNRIIRACPDPAISTFDFSRPLQDGHFSHARRSHLDGILKGSLDVPFPVGEMDDLKQRLRARASDESVDLVPCIDTLEGETVGDLLRCTLRLISQSRGSSARVVGLKDVWIADQIPALSRTFENARFVVIVRDPRAVVASILAFIETAPEEVGHILSVLRHWRKMVSCAHHFSADPMLSERVLLVRYEDVVANPERKARELCAFLGLEFAQEMLDISSFPDVVKGGKWKGNSAFDKSLSTISSAPVERWRKTLGNEVIATVEYCCGPDMSMLGYEPEHTAGELDADGRVLDFIVRDGERVPSWRSDFGDPLLDFGYEAARRQMICDGAPADAGLIRLTYLFEDYFSALRDHWIAAASGGKPAVRGAARQ